MVQSAEQTNQAEDKPIVLFLCTRNSARSQMAEAWLHELANERYVAASAGLEPSQIHPMTIQVMEEVGLPLDGHRSKPISEFLGRVPVRHIFVLKEPYKNIFVHLLRKSLREKFFSLSELRDLTDGEERSQRITELLKEITEQLDVGESLVITDRFMPTSQVQISFNQGLVSAGLGADSSFIAVRRLHVFKRSPTTVQIYDDKGSMVEVGFSFDIHNFITLLTVRAQQDKGQYRTHVYNVNLDSDLAENPKFFESALGIYEVLKNNNFEVLSSIQKPVKVKAKFTDRELKASLLLWKGKKQVGRADYEMTSPQGFTAKYYSINKTKGRESLKDQSGFVLRGFTTGDRGGIEPTTT